MIKNRIDVITLGCSKNLVDSEQLMRQFLACGYNVYHDASQVRGEIVVINTCGFIGDAKEESIETILTFAQAKTEGKIKRLFVMGCLSERYLKELSIEIPEVDHFFGKFDWNGLINELGHTFDETIKWERSLTTPSHYAYLKIAEGCSRTCSYCAIPIITGKYQSRAMEDILDEVRYLVDEGVKEFQVIAQDLTYYGKDRYKKLMLAPLVEAMAQIPGVEWIRLHYGYPSEFPYDLLPIMAKYDNVCKYMDIALQHISDPMLQKMRRKVTKAQTYELIERLRREVPGIHLRTTLLVGHPGETEQDFQELIEFAQHIRFERMGAFPYSEEDGTYAARHYIDEIPQEVKQQRMQQLMDLQQEISLQVNESKIGQNTKVIIDRKEGEYYIGRTQFDSPEVDPDVLIKSNKGMRLGHFYTVKITSAAPFELYAEYQK